MNSKKAMKLPGVILLIAGIIFIIAGTFVMIQGNSLKKRCTEQATATVVDVIRVSDYSTTESTYTYTYYPVIEYQVGDRTISQQSSSGQNPPKYKVGEQVEILYNPNNVEEFIIKGDFIPQYLGIGFIVLGTIAVAAGFFVFIRGNVRKPETIEDAPPSTPSDSF